MNGKTVQTIQLKDGDNSETSSHQVFIKTPDTQKWLGDADLMQSVIERIPLGKIGEP